MGGVLSSTEEEGCSDESCKLVELDVVGTVESHEDAREVGLQRGEDGFEKGARCWGGEQRACLGGEDHGRPDDHGDAGQMDANVDGVVVV